MSMTKFSLKTIKSPNILIVAGWGRLAIDIFYLTGEPISPHLLRRDLFAVYKYSFIGHSLQLQQSQLVDNPGTPQYILGVPFCRVPSEGSSDLMDSMI